MTDRKSEAGKRGCLVPSRARDIISPGALLVVAILLLSAVCANAMTVRVAIERELSAVHAVSDWPIYVTVSPGDKQPLPFDVRALNLQPSAGGFLINGKHYKCHSVTLSSTSPLKINGDKYQGSVTVSKDGKGKALVVNNIDLEDYVLGVVGEEMGPTWPMEALKAQAVASRTYALYQMSLAEDKAFDLDNSVTTQVYNGLKKASNTLRSAVFETRGLVAMYNSHIAPTFYHSNSGGMTASAREVWGGSKPYLVSRPTMYEDKAPNYRWRLAISDGELRARFRKAGFKMTHPITEIKPVSVSPSGRIRRIRVAFGSSGHRELNGAYFRKIVGDAAVQSTKFKVQKAGNGQFVIQGEGYGHGVGMSQWSAKGMAEHGSDYETILAHFYPGIRIARADIPDNSQLAKSMDIFEGWDTEIN